MQLCTTKLTIYVTQNELQNEETLCSSYLFFKKWTFRNTIKVKLVISYKLRLQFLTEIQDATQIQKQN